jgi:hypothetical protein
MALSPNQYITPQTPNRGFVQIANADGQNQKTVYTGGPNGTKITGLIGQSTDTSGRDVMVSITNGGTSYPLGSVTVAAGAGNSGAVASTNLMAPAQIPGLPVDSDGNPYLFLASASDTLTVEALSTVTSGKLITVIAIGADF